MIPRVVLADDLTGACEVAGLGADRGLRAEVCLEPDSGEPALGELRVFSTETRLLPPAAAAAQVKAFAKALPAGVPLFKKTDSVLRGPVAAELAALAEVRGVSRVLLVAANPDLHRHVVNGHYTVAGVPLHQTAFARDPHHPARTDHVGRLVGPWPGAGSTVIVDPGAPLPAQGLIVGNAASARDLATWARAAEPGLLAAGSAAFLGALLPPARAAAPGPAPEAPDVPTLLLSGTVIPAQRALAAQGPAVPLAREELDPTPLSRWIARVRGQLESHGTAVAFVAGEVARQPEVSQAVTDALAALGASITAAYAGRPLHLIVEGGATAAAVAGSAGWRRLRVVRTWGGGVVTAEPGDAPSLRVTVKPGSYPWPAALRARLFPSASPA